MAILLWHDDGKEISHKLCDGTTKIGRGPGNPIQFRSDKVSGKHALIRLEGDFFVLTDVGSKNGTLVNHGKRLTSPVKLMHKDKIIFGDVEAEFRDGPESTNVIVVKPNESSVLGKSESSYKEKLQAVLELSISLTGNINPDELLPKILNTLFEKIFKIADRGCILLKDDPTGELVVCARKHRQEGSDDSVCPSRHALDRVMKEKEGLLIKDAAIDIFFIDSDSVRRKQIHSMMCVPMLSLNGELIGAISIDSSNPRRQFSEEDLDILLVVAGEAAHSYETARLTAANLEKQSQDAELEMARKIQLDLLPKHLPEVPGYGFYASYDAAQAVGGDYYDAIELADGRICIAFGDVAGKGLPGALIMTRMHSCVRVTMDFVSDVETAIKAINTHMCDSPNEGRFVTFVLAILDPQTHELTLSNAGHPSPLIRHADGRIESFDEELAGVPIGVVEDFPYEVEAKTLKPGDMVLIVTDGVEDAMNPAGEWYGHERILELLQREQPSAKELGQSLLAEVRQHANGRAQNDDIAIFAFGRTGKP